MKAAVLYELGQAPRYADFPEPVPQNSGQLLVSVKAAAVKNLDKSRASGAHYSNYATLPAVVGLDGVSLLADGTRVYAIGLTGMIAEKALVAANKIVKIPAGLDNATAAALPNAALGAAAALRFRGKLQQGETVLINGATGVTGMLAIQLAKYYGAKKIIATGRNPESLKKLAALGADNIISLAAADDEITKQVKELHSAMPINLVLDYTWGHPAELILSAFKGEGIDAIATRVRLVSVGSMAGDRIQLSSAILRSSPIEICGSGLGSLSETEILKLNTELLPEIFQLAASGKLKIETVSVPLKDVETAWIQDIGGGKRLVIEV